MKKIILLLAILFIGCETDNNSASLQVQSDIDTTVARIGDVLNLSFVTQNTGERIVIFPDIQETESMEIRDKVILSKRNKPYQVNFQIAF